MKVLDSGSIEDIGLAKAGERRFIKQDEMAEELGILKSEMNEAADKEIKSGRLIRLSDNTLMSETKFSFLKTGVENLINDYHTDNPLADGIPRQELLSRLSSISPGTTKRSSTARRSLTERSN